MTSVGLASATTLIKRAHGSETANGTKTAPIQRQAIAATMKSTEFGMRSATRSPAATPRTRRPAPTRAVSSIN